MISGKYCSFMLVRVYLKYNKIKVLAGPAFLVFFENGDSCMTADENIPNRVPKILTP